MADAKLWIIGGPNGAGKTTLASEPRFQRLLWGVRFLNPDQVTLGKGINIIDPKAIPEITQSLRGSVEG